MASMSCWCLLAPSRWAAVSLEKSVCALVSGMVAAYSQRPGLLRAVISYSERHPDAAFRRRALELRERSMAGIEKVILLHAKEIKHPEQPPGRIRRADRAVVVVLIVGEAGPRSAGSDLDVHLDPPIP